MHLRPYQTEALDAIQREWQTHRATLINMATGLGKTIVMAGMVQRLFPKRILILVHRRVLAEQAIDKVAKATGATTALEMGMNSVVVGQQDFFGNLPRVIVASIQTMTAVDRNGRERMRKFSPTDFGALFCDEAHHAPAGQWRRVIEYFTAGNPALRVLGVTATPDRADNRALGSVFDSVACTKDILFGVEDGWLVPPKQRLVQVTDIDFSGIHTRGGDLDTNELAAVMEQEKALHGVVDQTMRQAGDRKTLVFTASVKQAEQTAMLFNRYREGSAAAISGGTPELDRARILQAFADGQIQFLCNCNVLTEGYDEWSVEVVALARPTKSRALYTQIVGRALRTQTGCIDGLETAEDRVEAIKTSLKPSATILDFEGNCGRHKLVCTADILGGKMPPPVVDKARRIMRRAECDTLDALEQAKLEYEQEYHAEQLRQAMMNKKRASLKAKTKAYISAVDPFDVLDIVPAAHHSAYGDQRRLSSKQMNVLKRAGISPDGRSYADNCRIIGEVLRRYREDLCTYQQAAILKKLGYDANCSKEDATKIISSHMGGFGRRG